MKFTKLDYKVLEFLSEHDYTNKSSVCTLYQIMVDVSISPGRLRMATYKFLKLGYVLNGEKQGKCKTYFITKEGMKFLNDRGGINDMKERILFIGVGQAGGNIASEFEKKGYLALYINTSNTDLETIESQNKFHVPAASGCNKDRRKALEYTKNHYDKIINMIDQKFPTQQQIFFCFSLGGGTGSGVSPVMLEILSKNDDKTLGAICVLPDKDESIKTRINSIESYKQLIEVEGLKNLYLLDNNNLGDKFEINKRFANLFDRLVNITIPDRRGIVDQAELEMLLGTQGSVFLTELKSMKADKNDPVFTTGEEVFKKSFEKSVFSKFKKGCKYLAISSRTELNTKPIEEITGKPIDVFQGYNKDTDFIACFGMPFPKGRTKDLMESVVEEKVEILKPEEEDFELVVPDLDFGGASKKVAITKEEEHKKESFDDIFNKYSKK